MKKIIMYIAVITLITPRLHCTIIEQLKKAKQELTKGKEGVATGKKGVEDGYTLIKTKLIDTLNTQIPVIQGQIDSQVNSIKPMADDIIGEKLPIIEAVLGTLTFLSAGTLTPLLVAVGAVHLVIRDVPKILNKVLTSLEAVITTLQTVNNTITPVSEKINPTAIPKPDVYVKFSSADAKFDDAIAKIDKLIGVLSKKKPVTK